MAKKFGGKFSPDGSDASEVVIDDREVDASAGRAGVLFPPAIVLVATTFSDGPVALITGLMGAGALVAAAWLLGEGLRAEAAYNARKVARRPAVPRKMLASALTGVGIALASFAHDANMLSALLYGAAGVAVHVAAFGLDPMRDKRMEGIDTFQQDRVARVVDEAELHLSVMKDQIDGLGDRALDIRVGAFQAAARKMIRTVEEDPRDLTGARKFLGVYLMGAKDATIKFVDVYRRSKNQAARTDYEALLGDLEQNFAARTNKMLLDDKSDMDIEIKVLRDRLRREGVRIK
ncbi:MAG: 5-bromo-4-chloroindolyl phosphate hydrolysis family protein [Yoonia sp.]|nr:5-bromo-4-chloroindolyl phosphate hydrolysis family protein [Yoonia sp.]